MSPFGDVSSFRLRSPKTGRYRSWPFPAPTVVHLPYRSDTLEGGPAGVKIAKQGTGLVAVPSSDVGLDGIRSGFNELIHRRVIGVAFATSAVEGASVVPGQLSSRPDTLG